MLEYNDRAGGRCWSLRGGDRFTELGGFEQTCGFAKDLYFNPGPWRIPYHHRGILDYCKRLGVSLEPFIQVNYNAYLHAKDIFGGKPQRLRHVLSDFHGNVAELLAKAVSQDKLDQPVGQEDKELLLAALRQWGALDADYAYKAGPLSSDRRGYAARSGRRPEWRGSAVGAARRLPRSCVRACGFASPWARSTSSSRRSSSRSAAWT